MAAGNAEYNGDDDNYADDDDIVWPLEMMPVVTMVMMMMTMMTMMIMIMMIAIVMMISIHELQMN
jgi:hypothetical protein